MGGLTRRGLAALLAGCLAACHRAAPPADLRTVRLAIHQDPIAFLPVHVSERLGHFAEEGLKVETSEVAGGSKALQALVGGSVDVAAASMPDVVQLAAQGRDVRGFLLVYTRPTAVLAVAPGQSRRLRSVGDLKGRTVGVSAPGSASHQILNFVLATSGLPPDAVSTVSVGMSAGSVAALEHGTVDAAVLLGSAIVTFERRQPDALFLVDLRTPAGARQVFGTEVFPSLGLVAEERWLHANPDTARRLARALLRGMCWVREHPAEEVRGMVSEGARMTEESDLKAIRQMQSVLSLDGLMPAAAPAVIERFLAVSNPKVGAAHVDVARTFTGEFTSAR
jgi:NitT/TauT family transport system substrate-binding protein